MTQQQMYVKRFFQGLTRTPRAAKRGLCTGRIITLPSDVLTRQQLREITHPCEHATADVLADDGRRVTLRCTWGCGRLIETAVTA